MAKNLKSLAKTTAVVAFVSTAIPLALPLHLTEALSADLREMLPDNIRAAGEITVASDTNFPPFEYIPPGSSEPIGLDVDITNALGEVLGVRFRYVSTAFDGIIPALQAGRYDVGISAMNDTVEREKVLDMISYTSGSGTAALVMAGNPKGIHGERDLCGKTVAVLSGSVQEKEVQEAAEKCKVDGIKTTEVRPFPDASSSYLALQSDQVDTVVTGGAPAIYQAQQSNRLMETKTIWPSKSLTAMAVPKGNDKLVAALKAALEQIQKDGKYAAILEKWGASEYALQEFSVNAAGAAAK